MREGRPRSRGGRRLGGVHSSAAANAGFWWMVGSSERRLQSRLSRRDRPAAPGAWRVDWRRSALLPRLGHKRLCRRTINSSLQSTLGATWRHTGSAGSGTVSAVAGRLTPIRWVDKMTPEDRDTLFVIAEVGVAFAGFASIVSVLSRRGGRDDRYLDLSRLRGMLFSSSVRSRSASSPPFHSGTGCRPSLRGVSQE